MDFSSVSCGKIYVILEKSVRLDTYGAIFRAMDTPTIDIPLLVKPPACDNQTPFRQQLLRPVNWFIDYCKEQELHVTEKDLEELHREGILFPAARIDFGYCVFRKIRAHFDGADKPEWRFVAEVQMDHFDADAIEIQRYYSTESLMMSGDDWLKWYSVRYPASDAYEPWKPTRHVHFTSNREETDGSYVYLYDKRQAIALRMIQNSLTYRSHISPHNITACAKFLRERVSDFNRFLAFYLAAEEMHTRWNKHGREKYLEYAKQFDEASAQQEWELDFRDTQLPAIRKEAEELLALHGMTERQVEHWQRELARCGVLHSEKLTKNYLLEIEESTLKSTEDTNHMIFILGQLLFAIGGDERPLRELLGGFTVRNRCSVCHHPFEPKRESQMTCGEKVCVDVHRNKTKQLKRKRKR